ncbi:MAG: GNAT family N-acetyltransferase [Synergistales bacterium]|nr:GNAT family N-acetyltransferase [Synergistales bacterium]
MKNGMISLPDGRAVEVRPCTTGDLEQILLLERDCFGPDAWSREFIMQILPVGLFLGLFCGGEMAGYGVLTIRRGTLHIDNLAVKSAYRRMHLGSHLLEVMLWIGRKNSCQDALLQVETNNRSALSLYEKFGFQKVRKLKHYYHRHGQPAGDAWEMGKVLDQD